MVSRGIKRARWIEDVALPQLGEEDATEVSTEDGGHNPSHDGAEGTDLDLDPILHRACKKLRLRLQHGCLGWKPEYKYRGAVTAGRAGLGVAIQTAVTTETMPPTSTLKGSGRSGVKEPDTGHTGSAVTGDGLF